MIILVPIAGGLAVLFSLYLARYVLTRDQGSEAMQDIAARIFEGAMAFLRRQYLTIAIFAIVVALGLGLLLGFLSKTDVNGDGLHTTFDKIGMGWRTGVCFLVGAICSALSGLIGMYISVKANLRCAAAAARGGLNDALVVAMRGGGVSGFLIVALSLLGVTAMYYIFDGNDRPDIAPFIIIGFGFGASFVALFAQLGGGIYTKAADVGADLVGKLEAGIPEDDARNAAVIADLVGDNVGDCAGRGADLFESTAAEQIGAMILGVAAYFTAKDVGMDHPEYWILFPLVVRAFGLIATMVGLLFVGVTKTENPMAALNRGLFVALALSVGGMAISVFVMLDSYWFFLAGLVGIGTSVAFVFLTQYYTEARYRPVKAIMQSSRTGSATNFLEGTAVGFETTFTTAVLIGIAILVAFTFGEQAEINGREIPNGGLLGTAVATMGMLMTAAYILAMDTFGPITDNANGIVEMSGTGRNVRHVTDQLDAVGNTTKALTKGYAMGSAGLAAFLLFSAYLDEVTKFKFLDLKGRFPSADEIVQGLGIPLPVPDISTPEVFVGGLLGAMLVYLFSALTIRAVRSAASDVIEEVRRQFRENPEIMTGAVRPDYARCVDITARAGLRQMIAPGVLAVGMPVLVGIIFRFAFDTGVESVAAFLIVGTIGGILMATFMNNAGGAWDNAKKGIESGLLGDTEAKGSAAHAAAVTGDTVGDPFKDTAGPSLHVLVKLLATVTLVLAPIFV